MKNLSLNSGLMMVTGGQGQRWTSVLDLSSHVDTQADTLHVGNVTHILLYRGLQSQLVSVQYSAGSYQLWFARSTPANITLAPGVETATIDIDSLGRMWLAYEGNNDINIQWSDSPYAVWQGPILLASGVDSDDICVVTALPTGHIGVFWSNQNTQRFGFRLHADGADPANWSADEVPASQSALPVGHGMADDHMHLAVASDGTLYAAVKTSYDTPGHPKVSLLIRRPNGKWDDLYEVDQGGTRPIVLLNEEEQRLLLVYATDSGFFPIVCKTSSTSNIQFSSREILLTDSLGNATSTKDKYTNEVVILASNDTICKGVLFTPGGSVKPLIGSWEMNEGAGITLLDSSTAGNNGTIFGNPTWVTGVNGLALRQDGSGDYSLVPNSPSLDITGNITLAAWIRPEKIATQRIINKTVAGQSGYSLFLSGNGFVSVRFNDNNTFRLNSSALYPANGTTWIHVAASYDGSTIRLYINGAEDASQSVPFSVLSNTSSLGIGAETNGNNSLQGTLDNVKIYNRALSLAEVQTLATA